MDWNRLPVVLAEAANVAVLGEVRLYRAAEGRWEVPAGFAAELRRQLPRHEDGLPDDEDSRLEARVAEVVELVNRHWPAAGDLDLALFRGPRLAGSRTAAGGRHVLALNVHLVCGVRETVVQRPLEDAERRVLLELAVVHEALHAKDPQADEAEILGAQRPWLDGLEPERLASLVVALRKVERLRAGSRPFLGFVESCTTRPVMEPLVDFALERVVEAAEPLGCRYARDLWGDELELRPYLAAKLHPAFAALKPVRSPGDLVGRIWTLPASLVSLVMLVVHALLTYRRERASQRDARQPVGQSLADLRARRLMPLFVGTRAILTFLGILLGLLFFFSGSVLAVLPTVAVRAGGLIPWHRDDVKTELVERGDVRGVAAYLPPQWRRCAETIAAGVGADHHAPCRLQEPLPPDRETMLLGLVAELQEEPSRARRPLAVRVAAPLVRTPGTETGQRSAAAAVRNALLTPATRTAALEELGWLLGPALVGAGGGHGPATRRDVEAAESAVETVVGVAATSDDGRLLRDLGGLVSQVLAMAPARHRLAVLEVLPRLPFDTWADSLDRWLGEIDHPLPETDRFERLLMDLAAELAARSDPEARRFAARLAVDLLRSESPERPQRALAILEEFLDDGKVRGAALDHVRRLVEGQKGSAARGVAAGPGAEAAWRRDLVGLLARSPHGETRHVLNLVLSELGEPALYHEAHVSALDLVDSRRVDERGAGLARLEDLAMQGDRGTRTRVLEELADQMASRNPEPAIRLLQTLLGRADFRSAVQTERELAAIVRAVVAPGGPGAILGGELQGLLEVVGSPRGLVVLAPGVVAAARQQVDGGLPLIETLFRRSEELGLDLRQHEDVSARLVAYLAEEATRPGGTDVVLAGERLLQLSPDAVARSLLPVLLSGAPGEQSLAGDLLARVLAYDSDLSTRRWVVEALGREVGRRPDGPVAETLVDRLLPEVVLDFPFEDRHEVVRMLLMLVRRSSDVEIQARTLTLIGQLVGGVGEPPPEAGETILSLALDRSAPGGVRSAALAILFDVVEHSSWSSLELLERLTPTHLDDDDRVVYLQALETRDFDSDLLHDWLRLPRGRELVTELLTHERTRFSVPPVLRALVLDGEPFRGPPDGEPPRGPGCPFGRGVGLHWLEVAISWLAHPAWDVRELARGLVESCVAVELEERQGRDEEVVSGLSLLAGDSPLLAGLAAGSGLEVAGCGSDREDCGETVWRAARRRFEVDVGSADLEPARRSVLAAFGAGWDLARLVQSGATPLPDVAQRLRAHAETTEDRGVDRRDGLVAQEPSGILRWWEEQRFQASVLGARFVAGNARDVETSLRAVDWSLELLDGWRSTQLMVDSETSLLRTASEALVDALYATSDPSEAAAAVNERIGRLLDLFMTHAGPWDRETFVVRRPSRRPEAYLEAAVAALEAAPEIASSLSFDLPSDARLHRPWRTVRGPQVLSRLLRLGFESGNPDLVRLAAAVIAGSPPSSWAEEEVVLRALVEAFDGGWPPPAADEAEEWSPPTPELARARGRLVREATRAVCWSPGLDDVLDFAFDAATRRNRELWPVLRQDVLQVLDSCQTPELRWTRRAVLEQLRTALVPALAEGRPNPLPVDELVDALATVGKLPGGSVDYSDDEAMDIEHYVQSVVATFHFPELSSGLRRLFADVAESSDWRARIVEDAMTDHEAERRWLAALTEGDVAAGEACEELLEAEWMEELTLELFRQRVGAVLSPACRALASEPLFCRGFREDPPGPLRISEECLVDASGDAARRCERRLLWWLPSQCEVELDGSLEDGPARRTVLHAVTTALAGADRRSRLSYDLRAFLRLLEEEGVISAQRRDQLLSMGDRPDPPPPSRPGR